MRFICDICPLTATTGQTVIIGSYEAWIQHLLTPQHQTEENLVMKRRSYYSYWTEANYTAVVKNLPAYDKFSADLYEDVAMQLSEYGFVEDIYHRKGTEAVGDTLYVAIQLYETKPFPRKLAFIDGKEFSVTLVMKPTTTSINGNGIINNRNGHEQRRRRRLSSSNISITGVENGSSSSPASSCGTPVSTPLEKKDCSVQCEIQYYARNKIFSTAISAIRNENTVDSRINNDICNGKRKGIGKRIQYDKETLLLLCGVKSLPKRFVDVLSFPMEIMLQEAKEIDQAQLMTKVVWEIRDVNIREHGSDDMKRKSEWRRRQPNEQTGWARPMEANYTGQKSQF